MFPVSLYTIPAKSLFKVFMNIPTSEQWEEGEACVECEWREKEFLRKDLNNQIKGRGYIKMTKKYTKPNEDFSYKEQYPEMQELGEDTRNLLYVGQGLGMISSEVVLRSDGFSKCSALVLKNTKTLESALFHLEQWNLDFEQTTIAGELIKNYVTNLKLDKAEEEKLSTLILAACRYWNRRDFADETFYDTAKRKEFGDRMAELNKDKIVKACFVKGDLSLDRKDIVLRDLLWYFGVREADEIFFRTGDFHWHIAYNPRDSLILVDSRMRKKVLTYTF